MAQITGAQNERVFSIQRWLGLHENPDGDTKLKMGEAALMRNWRVTRDGNLQKRPGTREILHLAQNENEKVLAVWTGFVSGEENVYAIVGVADGAGRLCKCASNDAWTATNIGSFTGTVCENPHMFGFADKLYILTGSSYYEYDGTTLQKVTGYIPLVAVSVPPEGGSGNGTTLEHVNKLNGYRRMWISGNGSGTVFHLPDTYPIQAVDYVKNLGTDEDVPTTDYTVNLTAGTVTFASASAPEEAENNYEIGWHVAEDFSESIYRMRCSELYNGSQDTRVFLYGDGSADAFYSDIDYNGTPRADYFPDMNQVRVGEANTPITALVRQYSRLIAFKTDSTWSIQFGQITTAEGNLIGAFYVTPVNKTIGHNSFDAEVQLVLNNPVCIMGSDLYEWFPNRGGNLTNDERQAKRISDRVYETLRSFDTDSIIGNGLRYVQTFDDNYNQEYYLFNNEGEALVWNYAADAWYCYDNWPMYRPFSFRGELYYGSRLGGIQRVSTDYTSDSFAGGDPEAIDCVWQSGSMSFGMDYQRKYAAAIWVGLKPESRSEVMVTVQTDKSGSYQEKVVGTALFGFDHVDFSDWTFDVNRKPQMRRLKIKAKKFVFYKMILMNKDEDISESAGQPSLDFSHTDFEHFTFAVEHKAFTSTSATITSVDMRVRFTGYCK
jgi:hypothetical protein